MFFLFRKGASIVMLDHLRVNLINKYILYLKTFKIRLWLRESVRLAQVDFKSCVVVITVMCFGQKMLVQPVTLVYERLSRRVSFWTENQHSLRNDEHLGEQWLIQILLKFAHHIVLWQDWSDKNFPFCVEDEHANTTRPIPPPKKKKHLRMFHCPSSSHPKSPVLGLRGFLFSPVNFSRPAHLGNGLEVSLASVHENVSFKACSQYQNILHLNKGHSFWSRTKSCIMCVDNYIWRHVYIDSWK